MIKLGKVTDFKKIVDSIFPDDSICLTKAEALGNSLIPKIKYISFNEGEQIKERLSSIEAAAQANNPGLPLLNLVHASLIYGQGKYEIALSMLEDCETKWSNSIDKATQACYSTMKGACHRSLGQKENALAAFHVTTRHFYDNPHQDFALFLYLISLYHIGEINAELGNYKAMLKQHEKFLALSQSSENVDMVNRALNGIGRAYLGLEDYNNCVKYLQLAEKNLSKGGNIPFIARNQHDIGIVYFKMKLYDDALEYLNKALKTRENHKLNDACTSSYILLGRVQLEQANFEKAIDALNRAKSIAEEFKITKKLPKIYELLSVVYEKNNKLELALSYHKKFHITNEKLNDVKNTQKENEKVREINTQLNQQKNIIEEQKVKIEEYTSSLVEANKQLQDFASIAAHDLKAPIRTVNSFVELLSRKYKNRWDDDDQEYIGFITRNMKSLSKMIDDLLSLSKLDQDLPSPTTINTAQLIDEILNRLQNKIKDIKPEILVQKELPNIVGHESLIGQLLQNLIDNALKYRSETTPKIQISYSECNELNEAKYITFEIKDNGRGIPDYLKGRVFELFSGSNGENSNGIGLATCKKIVSNYGGEIWVKSKEGVGTSVFFSLQAECGVEIV